MNDTTGVPNCYSQHDEFATKSQLERQGVYYRSRILNTNNNSNQLIAAAAPLFALLEKITKIRSANRQQLLQDLIHEVKAFENKAQISGLPSNFITAARYALCGLLDETITRTNWGKTNNWQNESLLFSLQKDAHNDNYFFEILERMLQNPAANIDLLELLYLCLSFGYAGKYQNSSNKHEELGAVIDRLYDQIRLVRDNADTHLFISSQTDAAASPTKMQWKKALVFCLGGIFMINVLFYVVSTLRLNAIAKPVYSSIKQHQDMVSSTNEDT
jgi:type VI secretion system protein ImpK